MEVFKSLTCAKPEPENSFGDFVCFWGFCGKIFFFDFVKFLSNRGSESGIPGFVASKLLMRQDKTFVEQFLIQKFSVPCYPTPESSIQQHTGRWNIGISRILEPGQKPIKVQKCKYYCTKEN